MIFKPQPMHVCELCGWMQPKQFNGHCDCCGDQPEWTGRMKLSAAIRNGADLNPQGFGNYYSDHRSTDGELCTCALGAAAEYLRQCYNVPRIDAINLLLETFELELDHARSHTWQQIVAWNDIDKKSRQEIADLLEARGL